MAKTQALFGIVKIAKTAKTHLKKQRSKVAFRKMYSENIQHIYRRTPMPKCDFNKLAFQLY